MKEKPGRRGTRVLLATLVLLGAVFAALLGFAYDAPSPGQELTLDAVYALTESRQIASASLLDEDAQVVGERCAGTAPPPADLSNDAAPTESRAGPVQCSAPVEAFHASYPRSDVATQELIARLAESGARVSVDKQTTKAIVKLVVTFVLPLAMLANLFGLILLSRASESSIAEIVGFGTIGRGKGQRKSTGVTLADVAGAEEAVAEMREVIDYLSDPGKFQEYGAAPPKGVLLFGSPGCGKTLLARAVAGESGVAFFSISGAEFVESLVGVGAARVRDLFREVRKVAPAIVFIDEIDAVGRLRGGDVGSGGEREQTVNQLLVEMDGFEVSTGIVVIAATNRPDILDPALMRPGRFDRHITMTPPDVQGREAILRLHARGRPIAADVDFGFLARRTPGFTGADLANVVNEAALLALREGRRSQVQTSHLAEAIQRVLHGPQRRGKLMTAAERRRIAFHEAGHAAVTVAVDRGAEVHRVSIVARGPGLGQSVVADDAERVLLTHSEMQGRLAIAMGGIAAEKLVLGESSTAGGTDIAKATAMAREMVGRYGMSAEVGPVRVLAASNGYLGPEGATVESVSGQTMQDFDQEVKRLIERAEATATELLIAHHEQLEVMVRALEEEETLEGPRLEAILSNIRAHPDAVANGSARRSARRARPPGRTRRGTVGAED